MEDEGYGTRLAGFRERVHARVRLGEFGLRVMGFTLRVTCFKLRISLCNPKVSIYGRRSKVAGPDRGSPGHSGRGIQA